jgi:hypothetical protein
MVAFLAVSIVKIQHINIQHLRWFGGGRVVVEPRFAFVQWGV